MNLTKKVAPRKDMPKSLGKQEAVMIANKRPPGRPPKVTTVVLTADAEDGLHRAKVAAAPSLAEKYRQSHGPHVAVVDALTAHLGDLPDARDWAERCVLYLADQARSRCDMPGALASRIVALSVSLEAERAQRG